MRPHEHRLRRRDHWRRGRGDWRCAELAASGRSTLLLEASPPGGRAWTYEIAGHRLDLGCGWLHSGDRNSWARIAEEAGLAVDRQPARWGVQYRHLGFSPGEQKAARAEFDAWMERLTVKPPPSDCAADALTPGGEWNGYLQAISGFISGARLERISVTDYLAYDDASTDQLARGRRIRRSDRFQPSDQNRAASRHAGRGNRA